MRFLAYLRSLYARFFQRSQIAIEMEEELRFHLEQRAGDLERSGLSPAEAQRRARIEFGGEGRFREEIREELGGHFIETLLTDLRYGVRVLRKSPAFTLVAIVTLALAVGANAVVFGVLNGFILRPLNVPRAQSLYGIEHGKEHSMYESYPDYLDLRDRNRSFEGLAAYNAAVAGLDAGENSSSVWVTEGSGNYFDVLGIQPYIGRLFHASDERGPNSAPYIVLGYDYWHTQFQDDRGVVGRVVRLNKHPFTIIGVTPPGFRGTLLFFSPAIYVPLVNQQQVEGASKLNVRGSESVFVGGMGHLKGGVTPEQAVADLNSIGAYLERTYPKDHGPTTFVLARPGLYGNYLGGPVRAFVSGLMLLTGLILLAACTNLGGLFAARAADRSREVALRLALGASRVRILRQLLTEASIIALAGGAAGLWASVALLQSLSLWKPFPRYPIFIPVTPDASVYAFALGLALVSGLLFGMVPARQTLKVDPYQVVKAGSTSGVSGRRITLRDLLLVLQIAICAVLVTSSIVALRGMARSLDSKLGFDPRNALLADTDLSMGRYPGEQLPVMQHRLIDTVEAIPGVESVGLAQTPPMFDGSKGSLVFADSTTDLRPSNAAFQSVRFNISPGYIEAAGTALLAGRTFSWHDDKDSPRVAVVNREFVRKLFGPATNPLGGRFKLKDGVRVEVVGVVEDGKYENIAEDPQPAIFVPVLQDEVSQACLVVRSNRDPRKLAAALRAALRNLDSSLPFFIQTWNQQLDLTLFPSRVATVSLGVLGLMGAMLSITGIFGMAAYSVSWRLKELGIRIALGAQRKDVLRAALGRAFTLLGLGSAAGLALGILASRVLESIVYQATPRDPLVIAGAVLAMLLLGLFATWIPAQRALSVNPLTLLREE